MLTVCQLVNFLYVLYTLQLVYKQIFVELADPDADVLHRIYRSLFQQNLLIVVLVAGLTLIIPDPLKTVHIPAFLHQVLALFHTLMDVILVMIFPMPLLVEVSEFYSTNTFSSRQKQWVVGSQILCVLLIGFLTLH